MSLLEKEGGEGEGGEEGRGEGGREERGGKRGGKRGEKKGRRTFSILRSISEKSFVKGSRVEPYSKAFV